MKTDEKRNIPLLSLQPISRGVSPFIIGRILLDVLELILNYLLTRALGTGLYEVYVYAHTPS